MTDDNIVDLKLVHQRRDEEQSAGEAHEIFEHIRAHRRDHWPHPPENAPVTLKELAELAYDRYRAVRDIADEISRAKLSKSERGREKYSVPDPERPWDFAGRDGQTVSQFVEVRFEEIRLLLMANNPGRAAELLRYTAGHIENAIGREQERRERAHRAVRQERLRQLEREKIEKEERRLSRVRNQVRKKLGGDAA
jgi:hypothetical protein